MNNVGISKWPTKILNYITNIFIGIATHIKENPLPDAKILLLSDANSDIHTIAYKHLDQNLFHPHSGVESTHSSRQNPDKKQWKQILDDFICIGSSDRCYTTANSNFSRSAIILGQIAVGNNNKSSDYYFVDGSGNIKKVS